MMTAPSQVASGRTVSPAALFVLVSAWIVVSLAGGRLAGTLSPLAWYDLSREATTSAMLFAGFYLVAKLGIPDLRALSSVGFVRRPGWSTEFGMGIALGWGIALALILPALLSGNLHLQFAWDSMSLLQSAISIVTLLAWALLTQLILSGLPVRLLVRAIGPGWTTAAIIFVSLLIAMPGGTDLGRSILFTALASGLFVTAFLRTRAIWLSLGMQIGWTVVLEVLFGATSPYSPTASGVVSNTTGGPTWLTGAPFGPECSIIGFFVVLIALVILFRVTRTYAWHYTYQPITAAGYPVEVAPPAEHVKAERAASAAPLVQIGGIGPAETPKR
ncbi:MAG: hypothetical protein ACRYGF_14365 [Janthinobacterium lividum]